MDSAPVERRLRRAGLLAGARPSLAGDRAGGQLYGGEQRCRQASRDLPIVSPFDAAEQLLADLDAFAEFYLQFKRDLDKFQSTIVVAIYTKIL